MIDCSSNQEGDGLSVPQIMEGSRTGLRFFTVYGPWGRPDMALFLFTRAILEGIGSNAPGELMVFIRMLEEKLKEKAEMELLPLQPWDMPTTYANIDELVREVGFASQTPIEEGIGRFVAWYRAYYRV